MNHEKTSAGWKSREKSMANNFYRKNMTMGARDDHEKSGGRLGAASGLSLYTE